MSWTDLPSQEFEDRNAFPINPLTLSPRRSNRPSTKSTCHGPVSHSFQSVRIHYLRRYEFTYGGISILIQRRVEGWDGDRCRTILYISSGRFMEIRSAYWSSIQWSVASIRSSAAPVPYVSLLPPSSLSRVYVCASWRWGGGREVSAGHWPWAAPLNMEESGEITIRRVRGGLRTRISLSCKLLSLRRLRL